VDLRRLITVIRAWLPLIGAATVLAGAAAFVASSLQPKVYEARATLIVGQTLSSSNPDVSQLQVAEGLAVTYASIAETRPILEGVISELGLDETTADVADRVQVDAPRGSTLMYISARDTDPKRAADIANEVGAQLIAATPAIRGIGSPDDQASIAKDLQSLRDLIDQTQTRFDELVALDGRTAAQNTELDTLQERLVSLRATYATMLSYASTGSSNVLTVVEPADVPAQPVSPNIPLNTLAAAALGLLVVAGVVFVAEQLDDSIRDADAVRDVTGLSNLGSISLIRGDRGRSEIYRMVTLLYPRSITAEAYRALRVNIEFASIDAPVQTILVTSAAPGEGKTMTSSNLAVVFAQAGRRVLLVDADLRWPAVHKYFDAQNERGLTSLLRGDATDVDAVAQPTEQPNLRLLTTGPLPPNPAEQLGSHRMQSVLAMLRASADVIIFDSPPILAVADAAVLSAFLDGTLLVIDASHGHRRQVGNANLALARAGANMLGTVLNRVAAADSFHYAGHYGESDSQAGRFVPAGTSETGASRDMTAGS
jgi:capsular exopolysaccharide synthesis family protein